MRAKVPTVLFPILGDMLGEGRQVEDSGSPTARDPTHSACTGTVRCVSDASTALADVAHRGVLVERFTVPVQVLRSSSFLG